MTDKAKAAVLAVLRRIQNDPPAAYYFDPITDSRVKLVAAHCEMNGLEEAAFRAEFDPTVKYEAPPRQADLAPPEPTHAMHEVPYAVQQIFEALYVGNDTDALRLTKQYVEAATGRVLPF